MQHAPVKHANTDVICQCLHLAYISITVIAGKLTQRQQELRIKKLKDMCNSSSGQGNVSQ
jgi:hypothetical protein